MTRWFTGTSSLHTNLLIFLDRLELQKCSVQMKRVLPLTSTLSSEAKRAIPFPFFPQQKGTPMKGLQVTSPIPPYPTEPVPPPQGKKGTSALSALLEMEQNQKWVSRGTAGQHTVCFHLMAAFFLLPVRTMEEQQQQQQQTKPSAAVNDSSNVSTAPTYVDSPRKVSSSAAWEDQNRLLPAFSFCRHI